MKQEIIENSLSKPTQKQSSRKLIQVNTILPEDLKHLQPNTYKLPVITHKDIMDAIDNSNDNNGVTVVMPKGLYFDQVFNNTKESLELKSALKGKVMLFSCSTLFDVDLPTCASLDYCCAADIRSEHGGFINNTPIYQSNDGFTHLNGFTIQSSEITKGLYTSCLLSQTISTNMIVAEGSMIQRGNHTNLYVKSDDIEIKDGLAKMIQNPIMSNSHSIAQKYGGRMYSDYKVETHVTLANGTDYVPKYDDHGVTIRPRYVDKVTLEKGKHGFKNASKLDRANKGALIHHIIGSNMWGPVGRFTIQSNGKIYKTDFEPKPPKLPTKDQKNNKERSEIISNLFHYGIAVKDSELHSMHSSSEHSQTFLPIFDDPKIATQLADKVDPNLIEGNKRPDKQLNKHEEQVEMPGFSL